MPAPDAAARRAAWLSSILTLHGIGAVFLAFAVGVPARRAPSTSRGTAPVRKPCQRPMHTALTLYGIGTAFLAFTIGVPARRGPGTSRGTAPVRKPCQRPMHTASHVVWDWNRVSRIRRRRARQASTGHKSRHGTRPQAAPTSDAHHPHVVWGWNRVSRVRRRRARPASTGHKSRHGTRPQTVTGVRCTPLSRCMGLEPRFSRSPSARPPGEHRTQLATRHPSATVPASDAHRSHVVWGWIRFLAFTDGVPARRAPDTSRDAAPARKPSRRPMHTILTLHGIGAVFLAFAVGVPARRAPDTSRGTGTRSQGISASETPGRQRCQRLTPRRIPSPVL